MRIHSNTYPTFIVMLLESVSEMINTTQLSVSLALSLYIHVCATSDLDLVCCHQVYALYDFRMCCHHLMYTCKHLMMFLSGQCPRVLGSQVLGPVLACPGCPTGSQNREPICDWAGQNERFGFLGCILIV